MTNNVHMSCVGISQLFKCFNYKSDPAAEFLKAASFTLLHMKTFEPVGPPTKNSDPYANTPLRAQCIFLEKVIFGVHFYVLSALHDAFCFYHCFLCLQFIVETGIIGRSALQENVPYSVIHSSLVDVSALGLK